MTSEWVRARLVGCDGTELVEVAIHGAGAPDLEALSVLSSLALHAQRRGLSVELVEPCCRADELLALVDLRLKVQRQPKPGEEPPGLEEREEEAELGDQAV
jgi:hypothetical protein